MEECLKSIVPKVSVDMNDSSTKILTKAKVEAPLKQMAPLKALGPYGCEAYFYQTH